VGPLSPPAMEGGSVAAGRPDKGGGSRVVRCGDRGAASRAVKAGGWGQGRAGELTEEIATGFTATPAVIDGRGNDGRWGTTRMTPRR
jgi:hypothetical protein